MKKTALSTLFLLAAMSSPLAQARGPIVGFDVLGLSNGDTNFYYQDRVFSNSAFRIGGASTNGGSLSVDLGFRFYFDRYANSPYLQGDMLFGSGTTTRVQLGMDIPMGNLVVDPNIWAGEGTNGVGLNIGLRL
jgi:hypothetical protein